MADRYWIGGSSNWASTANWSTTLGGPGGASVPTAADNVFFYQATTYTVTVTTATTINCFDFTASAGSPTFSMSGATININGNFDVSGSTGGNFFGSGPGINFGPTSGGTATLLTINCGTRGLATSGTVSFRWNSAAVFIYRLLSNLSLQNTSNTVTFVRGELDLNGYTITCGNFAAANASSKAITSGTGGKIVCNALSGTPFTVSGGATTITGDLLVQTTNSSSGSISIVLNIITNPISFLFTGSNYGLTFLDSSNARVKDITFSGGYSGTWVGRTNAQNVSGSITLSPGMTYGASTGVLSLTGSSGTQTITTNGRTWDGPINVNTTGATVQLADALAMGTRALTLTAGTFDGGGYSITGSAAITMITGPVTARNINTARTITHTSGTLTFGANNTTGDYTHTAGTIDLAGYQLTCTTFASNNANTRTIAFGTGNITCTGSGTAWTTATVTGLTVTGTPVVNITNSTATATTVAPGGPTEANAISFNITAGTYVLTFLSATNQAAGSVNFVSSGTTGFGGSWTPAGNVIIYGNLTLSSNMTFGASINRLTMTSTSATTRTVTTNGIAVNAPFYFDGPGGSWQLQDALTMAAGKSVYFRYGTFDGNSKTITATTVESTSSTLVAGQGVVTLKGIVTSSAFVHAYTAITFDSNITCGSYTFGGNSIPADLNLNGNTLSVTNVTCNTSSTALGLTFNAGTINVGTNFNASTALLTTIAGTGEGKIRFTSSSSKTFTGGSRTYNCTIVNAGAGLLIITGSNTITKISNEVQPTSFRFPSAATQTITDWAISGTAGNLVTITSSTSGSPATLSKTSGVVSADYLSIQDSAATGGATWYAGANSTNVSGNSGWIFTASPNTGAFFFLF